MNKNTKKTTKVTVTDLQRTRIMVDDVDVEIPVVVAKVTGTWESCGYKGTFDRDTNFAPTLGIWLAGESIVYMDGRQLDRTVSKLSSIRTKQPKGPVSN